MPVLEQIAGAGSIDEVNGRECREFHGPVRVIAGAQAQGLCSGVFDVGTVTDIRSGMFPTAAGETDEKCC